MTPFSRGMLKADSRIKFRFDEELSKLREMHDTCMSEDDRANLRKWAGQLAEVRKSMPSVGVFTSLKFEFTVQTGPDEFVSATIPIAALPEALACWERGEAYAPADLDRLVG
jgi:hypothetical protein